LDYKIFSFYIKHALKFKRPDSLAKDSLNKVSGSAEWHMSLDVQKTGRPCVHEERRKLTEVLCASECFQVHVGCACEIGHNFHKLVHDPGAP